MYRLLALFIFILNSCSTVTPPPQFQYREITTRDFNLVSWQKITRPGQPVKIYIEGDGHAFNPRGRVTADPTPQGTLLREVAFADPSPNVVYLARPCQFVKSDICAPRHWSTARFSPEVINSEYEAVQQIAGNNEVILIGYSGGAQVAGLIAAAKPGLNVKKLITIAGNLDHLAWTTAQNLPPLNESMNLESYRSQYLQIPQIHYVGSDDQVIPPALTKGFIRNDALIVTVTGATHGSGWKSIYPALWEQ